MILKKTLASVGTARRQADEDDRPFGLSEMMQRICQPCGNPDCTASPYSLRGIGSSCHVTGGFRVSVTDDVLNMRCRACGYGVLSCYVKEVDFLKQTCHPRGGCDVFFEGSTGCLSVCCHVCRTPLGGAAVTEAPQESQAPRESQPSQGPVLKGDASWGGEPAIDLTKLRLATDLDREMTADERHYYKDRLPRLDLPPAIVVPTRGGGSLKLSTGEGIVTLVAMNEESAQFAMTFHRTDFSRALLEGGHWECPGAGRLVASGRGRGRARLCLIAERGKKNASGGFSFVADLSISEALERL